MRVPSSGVTRVPGRWAAALLATLVVASGASGCGDNGQSSRDCIGVPTDPVAMVRSWSAGASFAIVQVGDKAGSTRVYDPGYSADVVDVTVESILADTSGKDASGIRQVANVRYPANECLIDPPAELTAGSRVLLVLGPPVPSKEQWSVDGSSSVLVLSDVPNGAEATWEGTSSLCSGQMRYAVADLATAAASPTSEPVHGTCLS